MRKKKTFIIAEVGPNHNGSIKKALSMVPEIAKAGADAIKFQLSNVEKVYSKDAFKADYQKKNDKSKSILEMGKKIQLNKQDHFKLFRLCKKFKTTYACSAFDLDSLIFLDKKIKVKFFKIASGEIHTEDMINYISKQNKKIILSTGMSTFSDIDLAVKKLKRYGNKNITILHCVSSYPAKKADLNLNLMDKLKERYKLDIGYSDHSAGQEACLAAVAKGATVIEKHVTTSRHLSGPDHKTSCTIKDFKNLVDKIRDLEVILGSTEKKFSKEELNIKKVARKSIVSNKVLFKGHKITKNDICYKRPGIGISPILIKKVIGKIVKNKIEKDRVIFPKKIKNF